MNKMKIWFVTAKTWASEHYHEAFAFLGLTVVLFLFAKKSKQPNPKNSIQTAERAAATAEGAADAHAKTAAKASDEATTLASEIKASEKRNAENLTAPDLAKKDDNEIASKFTQSGF